jgi:polysaccharide export outer membrane protein
MRTLLLAWLVFGLLGCSAPPSGTANLAAPPAAATAGSSTSAVDAGAPSYRIHAGDTLEIQVWKNQDLSRTVPVKPDGYISLPLLGEVRAGGLTPPQLREDLIKRLAEYIPSPEVSVIVSKVSYIVAVMGRVGSPGERELQRPATVLEVLAMSGGLTEFASTRGITVLRTEGTETRRIPFDYSAALAGETGANFLLLPGDIVVVP